MAKWAKWSYFHDSLVLIEYLHPHERIEDRSLQSLLLTNSLIRQDRCARKVKDQRDDELVDGLSDDHLPHGESNQWS